MRVALLQIGPRTTSWSANLAHVLERIVGAAEAIPAPDLIVLPAGCDGRVRDGLTEAMVVGFAESLAAAAREWGFYVAAGLLEASGDEFGQVARVYDPDGDVILRAGRLREGEDRVVRKTALGRLGIGLAPDGWPMEAPAEPCDLLLLAGRWSAPLGRREPALLELKARLGEFARGANAPVCAVGAVDDPTRAGDPALIGGSALYGPDGACLLAAGTAGEETLAAEVTIRSRGGPDA
jgi:predicted amidohydrolase